MRWFHNEEKKWASRRNWTPVDSHTLLTFRIRPAVQYWQLHADTTAEVPLNPAKNMGKEEAYTQHNNFFHHPSMCSFIQAKQLRAYCVWTDSVVATFHCYGLCLFFFDSPSGLLLIWQQAVPVANTIKYSTACSLLIMAARRKNKKTKQKRFINLQVWQKTTLSVELDFSAPAVLFYY